MGESKALLATYAEGVVGRGSRATIYFDGQSVEVVSIRRHATAAEVLVCFDVTGKVVMIDSRKISAVVAAQPPEQVH